ALEADGFQVARAAGLEVVWRQRLAFAHLGKRVEGVRPLEGRASGEALVEDRPQRVHVGPGADVLEASGCLLRRQVARRPQDGPLAGLPGLLAEPLGAPGAGR